MLHVGRRGKTKQRLMVASIAIALGGALAYGAFALAPRGQSAEDVGELDTAALLRNAEPSAAPETPETLGPHAEIVRPAAVIEVTAQRPIEIRTFPGTLHPARSSQLAFRVGGPLVRLPVEEGDLVAAGSLLAEIDPRDFELAVAELSARLDAARAAQQLAVLHHRRQAQLVERGHASRAILDAAIADRDRTAAETVSLTQQLETARAARDDTRLTAPFDGRVARLHVEQHDYVLARQPAIVFHDISATDFIVDLPERMIGRLPYLQAIEVTLSDTAGRSYSAVIREMASEQAADTGTYRTALRLSGIEGEPPLAGLSGTASLTFLANGFQRTGEFVLPSSAVFRGASGGDYVWVVEGTPARVSARPVTLAAIEGDRTRVASGLENGEGVVAYGVDFLQEGQLVRARTPTREPADGGASGWLGAQR